MFSNEAQCCLGTSAVLWMFPSVPERCCNLMSRYRRERRAGTIICGEMDEIGSSNGWQGAVFIAPAFAHDFNEVVAFCTVLGRSFRSLHAKVKYFDKRFAVFCNICFALTLCLSDRD